MSDDDFWGEEVKGRTSGGAAANGVATGGVRKEAMEGSASLEQQAEASATPSTTIDVERRSHTSSSAGSYTSSSDPFYSDDSSQSDSEDIPINKVALSGSHSTSEDQAQAFRFTPIASPSQTYPANIATRRASPSPTKQKTVDLYVVKHGTTTKKAKSKATNDNSKTERRKRRSRLSADVDVKTKSATTVATFLSSGRSEAVMPSSRSTTLVDRVHFLELKLREALTMNRTLENIQKRQDAALARVAKERLAVGNDGRPLADRHSEEVRVLREQVRLQRHKLHDQERLLSKRNAAMQRITDKAKQLETALKDGKVPSLKAGEKSRPPTATMQAELEEKSTRVQKLQRQVQLLEKNHRHALGIEVARHKETQTRLLELEQELNRVRKQRSSFVHHQRPPVNEPQSTAMATDAGAEKKRTQRRSESESKGKPAMKESINSRAIHATGQSPSETVVSPKPGKAKSKTVATDGRKKAKSRSVGKRSASITDEARSVKDDSSSSSDAPSPHPAIVGLLKLNPKLSLNLPKSRRAYSLGTSAPPAASNDDVNTILNNLTFRRNSVNRERTFAVNKDPAPPLATATAGKSSVRMNPSERRHDSLSHQASAVASKLTDADPFASLKPARVSRNASQNSSKSQPTQANRRNSLLDELFGPKRLTQSAELRPKILSDFKDEDLFPELKQKQHASASNATTSRRNVGLFPWENTAGASASTKSYDIAQFS